MSDAIQRVGLSGPGRLVRIAEVSARAGVEVTVLEPAAARSPRDEAAHENEPRLAVPSCHGRR